MVLANQRPLMPRTSHWLEMVGRVMARSQERAAASAKISALARVGCALFLLLFMVERLVVVFAR